MAMISAVVPVNSSLLVHPANALTITFTKKETISPIHDEHDSERASSPAFTASRDSIYESSGGKTFVSLTNLSNKKQVVFKFRTTNTDMFTVTPAQGILACGATINVAIKVVPRAIDTLLTMTQEEFTRLRAEQFLIQSVERAEDTLRGFDMTDLRAFWERMPSELVTNTRLMCRFALEILPDTKFTFTKDGIMPQETRISTTAESINSVSSDLVFGKSYYVDSVASNRSLLDEEHTGMNNGTVISVANGLSSVPTLFSVHPSNTLLFQVKNRNNERTAKASFFISNPSSINGIAFKIKTTNRKGYFVKPNRGVIGPNQAQTIEVFLFDEESEQERDPGKDENEEVKRGEAVPLDFWTREVNDRFLVDVVGIKPRKYAALMQLREEERKQAITALLAKCKPLEHDMSILKCKIIDMNVLNEMRTPPTSANAPDISLVTMTTPPTSATSMLLMELYAKQTPFVVPAVADADALLAPTSNQKPMRVSEIMESNRKMSMDKMFLDTNSDRKESFLPPDMLLGMSEMKVSSSNASYDSLMGLSDGANAFGSEILGFSDANSNTFQSDVMTLSDTKQVPGSSVSGFSNQTSTSGSYIFGTSKTSDYIVGSDSMGVSYRYEGVV